MEGRRANIKKGPPDVLNTRIVSLYARGVMSFSSLDQHRKVQCQGAPCSNCYDRKVEAQVQQCVDVLQCGPPSGWTLMPLRRGAVHVGPLERETSDGAGIRWDHP